LLKTNFPESRFLDESSTRNLFAQLAEYGLSGGSVYDALVGAAAVAHGLPLASRDRRAADIYRLLSVNLEMLA